MDINEIRTLAGLPPVTPEKKEQMDSKEVPSNVSSALKKKIKECEDAISRLSQTNADDGERKRVMTICELMADLDKKLDGTAHGFKMAQHLFTSAMNVYNNEVPGEVVQYLMDDVQALLNHTDVNRGSIGNNRKQLRDYLTGRFTTS